MASSLALATLLATLAVMVSGHSYHLGSCPVVEPMADFDMNAFLGKWYVIQKTSTGSRCLTNNYTIDGEHPGQFSLEQVSQHPVLGLTNVDHLYRYTGGLKQNEGSNSAANMTVRFPLSVAGSAQYRVFMTDYNTYAGVFTCQKLAFANRQSATILSRAPTLDKIYVDKVRNRLSAFGVDPYDLSIIDHTNCPDPSKKHGVNINIDDDTFTAGSVAGVVRKAGEKIGDGIEVAAEGAKKIYHKVRGDGSDPDIEEVDRRGGRGRLQEMDPDAEWLP